MNVGLAGATHFGGVASPWTSPVLSGSDNAAPPAGDSVSIGNQEAPPALMANTAAEADSAPRRSLRVGLTMGLMVAASLVGGCASLAAGGPQSAHSLAQNTTGRMVHTGYQSIAYIDQQTAPVGGGLYSDKKATPESRLAPIDAMDRMLDGKKLYYKAKADGKPQEIRSWAELRGFEQMLKDSVSRSR